MIDRDQLRSLHGVDLPLHVLEQDYIQALFLQELYRDTEALVFKGGTFLKHGHGLDRFSEDLDFTSHGEVAVLDRLEAATAALGRYGVEAELNHVDRRETTLLARLRYRGPLYDGSDRSRGSVELEVSTRDDIVREPEWRRLFFPYPDTRAVTARCLRVEEALAEKVRALSTRTRGRDLYDCWFLLQQGVDLDTDLFERKMTAVGAPATVTLTVTERDWERDLEILLEHPPDFGLVRSSVVSALRRAGFEVEDEAG